MKNIINSLLVLALLIIMLWNSFGSDSFRDLFNLDSIPTSRASFFIYALLLFGFVIFRRRSVKSQKDGFVRKINGTQNLFFLVIAIGAFFIAITGYGFQ